MESLHGTSCLLGKMSKVCRDNKRFIATQAISPNLKIRIFLIPEKGVLTTSYYFGVSQSHFVNYRTDFLLELQ